MILRVPKPLQLPPLLVGFSLPYLLGHVSKALGIVGHILHLVTKKIEFLSLQQTKSMAIAKYLNRFLTLEWFAPGGSTIERERAVQFEDQHSLCDHYTDVCNLVRGHMRVTECEHSHVAHHQARGTGQANRQARETCQTSHQGRRHRGTGVAPLVLG